MRKSLLALAVGATLAISGCSTHNPQDTNLASAEATQSNPLFAKSTLQYQAPDFRLIKDEHFKPALEAGIAEHYQEVLAIANNPEKPTFANTIVALEKSGELLSRASSVFYNLTGSNSNPELRKIQGEMAPKMAAHSDNVNLNPELFVRIDSLYSQRQQLGLSSEEVRLIEVYHQRFVLAGAKLTENEKAQIRALNEEQSKLVNEFQQRLMRMNKEIAVTVTDVAQLEGLSDSAIRNAAADAKQPGSMVNT